MESGARRDEVRRHLAQQREKLLASRRLSPIAAVVARFKEIDGGTQGALVSLQLFTVVVPLMILGFSYLKGFADTVNPGTVWIRELGLSGSTGDTVRGAFSETAALRSVWTVARYFAP